MRRAWSSSMARSVRRAGDAVASPESGIKANVAPLRSWALPRDKAPCGWCREAGGWRRGRRIGVVAVCEHEFRGILPARLVAKVPRGRWHTRALWRSGSFIAALRDDRAEAPWLLDGPVDGACFLARRLRPRLRREGTGPDAAAARHRHPRRRNGPGEEQSSAVPRGRRCARPSAPPVPCGCSLVCNRANGYRFGPDTWVTGRSSSACLVLLLLLDLWR
jgi:hypothetical protein